MAQGAALVLDWLSALKLAQYVEAFVDNGYDDLEVCKQIGGPDLDAIGVRLEHHRRRLLSAVARLRSEEEHHHQKSPGYYFTLEPLDPEGFSSCSPPPPPPPPHLEIREVWGWGGTSRQAPGSSATAPGHQASCPGHHDPRVTDCNDFVIYPKLKLKILIRDKLAKDGINLSKAPYTHK
ncbi:hypothetical protein CRUP_016888, partial [Coryphaenoides rupestris]